MLLNGGDNPASTPVSALLGSKFRSPAARRGMVRRTGLVDRLLAADEPVISVVAPPGYGKTTLLAQWAERRNPRVAWVSCEETDNDPVALWSALIKALNAIGPVDSAATQQLATNGSGIGAVPGFVAAIESIGEPVTIVLDHLEVISSKECQAAIAEFALRVPQGWQLAMASRERLPIPDARLRAERQIVEIDVADLAMTGNEARALLSGAGVQLSRPDVEELVQRTEGWPVGLYLAALALKDGAPPAGFTFTGDDRLMGDYLRSELLPRVTATQADFLIRTSVLDRISGPLCDAVVGGAWIRGFARADGEPQSPHRSTRPTPRVVPLPPSAARALASRAPDPRSGRDSSAALAGSRLVRGEQHARDGDRARSRCR